MMAKNRTTNYEMRQDGRRRDIICYVCFKTVYKGRDGKQPDGSTIINRYQAANVNCHKCGKPSLRPGQLMELRMSRGGL